MAHSTPENISAKVLIPKELADYQAGSVVSRAIIKKNAGNVTIFAFDSGEMLSEHTAPYDAVVIILDGAAEIVIGGVGNVLSAGEMIIMPANVAHSVKAIEKFKMMLIMIKE